MYRPEGWRKHKLKFPQDFEGGADALLKALKKTGYPIRQKGDIYFHGIDATGTLVFIPDEVKRR